MTDNRKCAPEALVDGINVWAEEVTIHQELDRLHGEALDKLSANFQTAMNEILHTAVEEHIISFRDLYDAQRVFQLLTAFRPSYLWKLGDVFKQDHYSE